VAGEYSSLRRIPLRREMGKTLSGTRLHTVRGLRIDKSTLSVSPLLVIEAHSEKKETVVVGAGKVSEFVVVGAGSSGSVGNRRLLDAAHSVVRAPSRRTTRRVDRR
jgi:hypothetical protein